MNSRIIHFVFTIGLLALLNGCASTAATKSSSVADDSANAKNVAIESAADDEKSAADENLPNMEFDEELLQQVLISNFASFNADWSLGAQNALMAANKSQDYRLARLAALLALRAKDYAIATEGAELWSTLTDDSVEAQTTLLLAQLGNGDTEAAYAGFKQRQLDKPIEDYVKDIAGLLLRQTNDDVAIELAERYLQEYPDSAQVALSFSYVAEGFGRSELLSQWVTRALELRPDWDTAAQMKLSLLRKQGKTEEAAQYLTDYVAAHPKSVGMRINHAAELARQKNYDSALQVMQAVLKDDPSNVPALKYAAALAQQLQQLALAKDYYRKVLKVDSKDDETRWSLARFEVLDENYAEAERYYQAIEGEQNYFQAQLQVANMRYYTKGLKSAKKYLRALDPKTETEYVDRATTLHYLLMQDHQYEEAYGSINEALIYLPENSELLYSRALVAAELQELQVVETDLRSILARQPDHANALNALGYTLADQTDRYEEAKELIGKALDLRPNDVHILDSMGWVLYRLDDYPQALEYLQQAYDQTGEVEVAAHLGEVLWESGEFERARQVWQQAFEKDADNPLLVKTLDRYGIDEQSLAADSISLVTQ